AGADHVRVDLRGAARVRRTPVVRVVDGDAAAVAVLHEPGEGLVAREPRVAVQLGREDLDAGGRGAEADVAVGRGQRAEDPRGIRRARRAGYAEEDAHTVLTSAPWRPRGRPRAVSGWRRRGRRTPASASRDGRSSDTSGGRSGT